MNSKRPFLSVIVPAYNEAGRIGAVLLDARRYVGSIVVVVANPQGEPASDTPDKDGGADAARPQQGRDILAKSKEARVRAKLQGKSPQFRLLGPAPAIKSTPRAEPAKARSMVS
jgi:hypothetical protein